MADDLEQIRMQFWWVGGWGGNRPIEQSTASLRIAGSGVPPVGIKILRDAGL